MSKPSNKVLAILLALVAAATLASEAFAQTNATAHPSNRWLFVVETSKELRSRAMSVSQFAGWMVASGMKGQMHGGDTLGLWTFNDDLHTGKFPLQTMAPDAFDKSGRQIFEFLKGQKFEKKCRFEKVLSDLNQVVKDSAFITVILISSGAETISGTPFDDRINAAYKASKKAQEKARAPFVVALRARQGQFTDCTVSLPPEPFELPPLPPELIPPKVVAVTPPAEPPPAPPVQPLIMKGNKVVSAPWTNEVPAGIEAPK